MKPLAIDLYAGLGGWTEGLMAEGYRVVGFDCERHQYGHARYPARLVIQDVLTIHGSQFRNAALIVASPPCQAYSYRAMPSRRTIYNWLATGKLAYVRTAGGNVRIFVDSLFVKGNVSAVGTIEQAEES